ncbi:Protein sickie [Amphibalanus amphitrite]|uniref:Protein sickie n=1 Tax=Amphibalanus amphitrite TaxID=1232801 RepID=A0A6A4VZI7_AMPAM|nr:Protein sickie [Amphibalanus amphitrite]
MDFSVAPAPFLPAAGAEPGTAWPRWIRMFDNFLVAVGGGSFSAARKEAILLTCLGAEGQRIFESLPAAVKQEGEDQYAFTRRRLEAQFAPRQNVCVERYRFRSRVQQTEETVQQWVSILRQLASSCEYGDRTDEFIRDQVIERTNSSKLRQRLLMEGSDLTLERTLTISDTLESAEPAAVTEEELRDASASDECLDVIRGYLAGRWPRQRDVDPRATGFYQRLMIDVIGPMQGPQHERYGIVLCDMFSRWPEVALCRDATAASIISFLEAVFSREGLPAHPLLGTQKSCSQPLSNPKVYRPSGGGGRTSVWRVGTPPGLATMASDRPAYYSHTEPAGSATSQKAPHSAEFGGAARASQPAAPHFRQISQTQWKQALEGRDQRRLVSASHEPPAGRQHREQSQTPLGQQPRENGTSTSEPAVTAAAESPGLKLSRQKLRKSAAIYTKRPSSQTSVSSAGSAGLPPKDPEHRPRTKVKVSGSTQTTAELAGQPEQRRTHQLKSYSLTAPAAHQLAQAVRERVLAAGTLPTAGQRQRAANVSDGSLSDSNYSGYGEPRRAPAQRPSSAYTTYVGQQLAKTLRGSMTEAESLESVSSGASGLLSQSHSQRSGSLTQGRLMGGGQWEAGPSPRLSRSNSIRSTRSEKLNSGALLRAGSADEEAYYSAPAPGSPSRASFPLSPGAGRSSCGARASKDDDAHGSSLSLVSTTSSIYSAQEEKQASDHRRLKRELLESQEKVQTLTNQLTTNVSASTADQPITLTTSPSH